MSDRRRSFPALSQCAVNLHNTDFLMQIMQADSSLSATLHNIFPSVILYVK